MERLLGDNWKEILNKNNIKLLSTHDDFIKIFDEHTIITSRCSKTKTGKNKATPREFYVSDINIRFYECMEEENHKYAILSDLYGIHFYNELLDYYDVHPSKLSNEDKVRLGKIIKEKCSNRGYNKIIFYNSSPLMSQPYFEMLLNSGLDLYYTTNLKVFKKQQKKILARLF